MDTTLQFQLRITASPELAEALRHDTAFAAQPALLPAIQALLHRYDATLKCQFDAFAGYVSEAEQLGVAHYPLYQWTKDTIENPQKKVRYLLAFTVYVNGREVYDRAVADALEAGLRALVDETGILSVSRFDTNPANNPQPPQR
ncbi:hypothetical protein [Paraburkholderia sp. GAS199]|uniref:hypothetical protein n=1 Tax=Paraburkholderia sp. GAS199 TaxID=3035126 RepID=UPI003D206B26